jgi:opacity protein-like surface antigen
MFAKHKALVLAAALLAAGAAQAQVAVTADAGTTGAGVHLVVPMETYLNGRFGVNAFNHDMTKHSGMVDYDIKGKLQTADILFDWYVRDGSAFHLTGGIVYNNNHFNAVATPSALGQFSLNGNTYTAADVGLLSGDIEFRKAAPYVGIGWGNPLAASSRWQFSAELGTFYEGDPKVHLVSMGCVTSNTVCKAVATDVAAEAKRLQGDLSGYRFYPVARASLSYRF